MSVNWSFVLPDNPAHRFYAVRMYRLVRRSASLEANRPFGEFGMDCQHFYCDRLQRVSGNGVWGTLHAAQFLASNDNSIPRFHSPIRPDLLLRCDGRGFELCRERKLQRGVGDNSHHLGLRANVVCCVPLPLSLEAKGCASMCKHTLKGCFGYPPDPT